MENELSQLKSRVEGMLAEALASAALATSVSNDNRSMEAIARIELRQVQAALNNEVQSRLTLEKNLEAMQTTAEEAESKRLALMDELFRRENTVLKRLESNELALNSQESLIEDLSQSDLKNRVSSLSEQVHTDVIELIQLILFIQP